MLPLWDMQPARRASIITPMLIAANLGVFVYEIVLRLSGGGALETFLITHALVPSRLLAGWDNQDQWLTLLTHQFLHGSVSHVAGNCWFLWVFGRNVEARLGGFAYLFFYLLSGLAAAGLQTLFGPFSSVPMIGASGAISGVLGAYFILLPTGWILTLVPWIVPVLPVPAFVFLIVWFAMQTMNGIGSLGAGSASAGGVAWWAHAGGFAAGVCLTLWGKGGGGGKRR